MTIWRLELIRLIRTRRLVTLAAVFLLFGLGSPVLQRYLGQIVGSAVSGGMQIVIPPPTAPDGIAAYAKNVEQIGLIVIVVVAAMTLSVNARPQLAVFYRTRVRRASDLVLPRFVAVTVATLACYFIGAMAAWYETWVLIGAPPVLPLFLHIGCTMLYLGFAIALVALVGELAGGALAVVGICLVLLIAVLPVLGTVQTIQSWLPSWLPDSAKPLLAESATAADYWHAAAITVACTAVLLVLAVRRAGDATTARRSIRLVEENVR